VTVIRETTATATAPAQIAAVQEANRRRANGGHEEGRGAGMVAIAEDDDSSSDLPVTEAGGDVVEDGDGADAEGA
jgi:hypothetical protein